MVVMLPLEYCIVMLIVMVMMLARMVAVILMNNTHPLNKLPLLIYGTQTLVIKGSIFSDNDIHEYQSS